MRILKTCGTLALAAAIPVTAAALAQAKKAPSPAAPRASALPEAPPTRVIRYDSQSRRDPFLNPLSIRKKSEAPDEEIDRGAAPAGIAGMSVTQVVLQGISSRDDSRVAVFRGTDKRAYFLQEGDKFFDGYLRTIDEDSVVLVRQRQYKSGKTVTDEITRRLRTP